MLPPKVFTCPFRRYIRSYICVADLFAHNNISQICYCGQISLQNAAVNCSFSNNLTPLGVALNFAVPLLCTFHFFHSASSNTVHAVHIYAKLILFVFLIYIFVYSTSLRVKVTAPMSALFPSLFPKSFQYHLKLASIAHFHPVFSWLHTATPRG